MARDRRYEQRTHDPDVYSDDERREADERGHNSTPVRRAESNHHPHIPIPIEREPRRDTTPHDPNPDNHQ